MEVDPAQTVVQRRLVEVTVVVDLATDVWIDPLGKIIKGRVGPILETPSPDFATHRLQRPLGRCWQNATPYVPLGHFVNLGRNV